MKTGLSTLNPYAASYVPLSKRELAESIDVHGVTTKVDSNNQTVCFGPADHATHNRQHEKTSFVNDGSALKNLSSDGFCGSSSQSSSEMTDHQIMDDLFDMHLVYLQMQFPGISDDSLNDVYIANKGDLEATVDMLHQLETLLIKEDYVYQQIGMSSITPLKLCISVFDCWDNPNEKQVQLKFDPFESPENLPDSLDIGDIAELGSSAECGLKSKNVVGDAGASSSGSTASDTVIVS